LYLSKEFFDCGYSNKAINIKLVHGH
jgi:hypothetical protein